MESNHRTLYPISRVQETVSGHHWLRVGIVIGVILLSIALATKAQQRLLLLALALPLGYIGAQLVARWPGAGLLALIVGAFLVRQNIGPANVAIVLPIVLTAFWLLDMVARRRQFNFIASPTFTPLLLFLVVAVISLLVGQLPWFPLQAAPMTAQIGGMLIFIGAVLTYVLAAHHIKDLRWLKLITYLFLFLGALAIASRVIPGIQPYLRSQFSSGAFGGVFWLWVIILPFSLGVFNKRLKWHWRALLLALAFVAIHNAFFVNRSWSSGWAPAMIALLVILWVATPRVALPVSLVVGLALILLGYVDIIFQEIVYGDNEYSTLTRLEAWGIMIEIVKASPILGLGPSNYYWYTPLYNILGWYLQFNSHHNLIDIVAQTGLLGLSCFLWFFWRVGQLCLSLRLRVSPDGFAYAFVLAATGGIVGMFVATMLGDWVLPFFYNVGINGFRAAMFGWLFLGCLVAIEQMLLTSEPGESTAP